MPDFGSPIAQNVNVNPAQGIQTLSGLLSLKQQQQQLQIGAAEVYQAQQDATERQNLAQIPWKSFQNADGSFDMDKVAAAALQVAPTKGQGFVTRFAAMAEGGAATKKAYYALSQDYQDRIRSLFGAWAGDRNAQLPDLASQADLLKENAPESSKPQVSQLVDHSLKILSQPDLISGAPKSIDQQKHQALLFSQAGLGGSEVAGPGGIATPIPGTTIGKGGQLVGTAQSRTTGAIAPTPGGVPLGLAPTQTPGYLQTAAAAGGVGNVDVQRFSGVTNAAATAQTGVALADQVADLAQQVRTGRLTKDWADKLTVLQQHDPSFTAQQMLAKYAAQLKTTATQGAATDQERAQIDAGMPAPETMGPDAVRKAAQYLHGYFRMNQARGLNALQHLNTTGTPAGFTQSDTGFMQTKDPFVYTFKDMNPAQKTQFLLERYGPGGSKDPQGFADFERRVKGSP